jgi:hypothetical protein
MTCIEVYNTNIVNLLKDFTPESSSTTDEKENNNDVKSNSKKDQESIVIHDSASVGIFLTGSPNLRVPVKSTQEALNVLTKAVKSRSMRAMEHNPTSSRFYK